MTQKIEMTKTYKTRDGCPVRIYAIDSGGMHPVHGAFWHEGRRRWVPDMWTAVGKYFVEGKNDLIEVEEENWAYFLLYESGKCECNDGFSSKENAKEALEWAIARHNETADFMGYQKIVRYGISKLENVITKSE